MAKVRKPRGTTDEQLAILDSHYKRGATIALKKLQSESDISEGQAMKILSYWLSTQEDKK